MSLDANRWLADHIGVTPKMIKSFQVVRYSDGTARTPGDGYTYTDIPIDTVVPENCFVAILGSITISSSVYLRVTGPNTLTFCQGAVGENSYCIAVFELDPTVIKSRQSGTAELPGSTDVNISINSVNPDKCITTCFSWSYSSGSHYIYPVLIKSLTTSVLTLRHNYDNRYELGCWDILELR